MYKDTMLIKQLKMENKIWYLWDFLTGMKISCILSCFANQGDWDALLC